MMMMMMMMMSVYMPFTSSSLMVSNFALCGMPFLAGFYSMDFILEMFSIDFFLLFVSTGLTVKRRDIHLLRRQINFDRYQKLAALDCLATSVHRLCQLFKGTLNPRTVRHPRTTDRLIVIIQGR